MLKNLIGSLVFTAAVFVLIDFIGNALIPQTVLFQQASYTGQTMGKMTSSMDKKAKDKKAMDKKASAATVPTPEAPQPVPTPQPAPTPTLAPAEKISVPGDAAVGQKLFKRKCAGCHTAKKGGGNRTGPNLWGIVGRDQASASGFRYSKAFKALSGAWNAAEINNFITRPRDFVPGTKMGFSGFKKAQDRANIVAYLETLKD